MAVNAESPSVREKGFLDDIDGMDIAEALAAGGIMGTIIYVVGQAVATLPAAFVDATVASTLAVVGGALSFAWTLINNSKKPKS